MVEVRPKQPRKRPKVDVEFFQGFSVALIRLNTRRARRWFRENVGGELVGFGDKIACEPRYVDEVSNGMIEAGLTVAF